MSVQSPYELLGGEQGIRRLSEAFYNAMDRLPEATTIRAMHGKNLESIKQRLFEFLSGWLGGPPLFMERHGTVCITSSHSPFAIGAAERDQWLFCMDQALADIGASDEAKTLLKEPLYRLADFLRTDKR